jgi:hypothetical protein
MTATLQLYLRGDIFQEIVIEIPDFKGLGFKERVNLRTAYVKSKCLTLRAIYHNAIDKCGGRFQIVMVVRSKVESIPDEQTLKQAV